MKTQINIKSETDLPARLAVIDWYQQLFESLVLTNQRLIVSLQGSRAWCLSMLPEQGMFKSELILSNEQDLGNRFDGSTVVFKKAENLLGQETDCVLYDGFSGLNIDVFCMAAGLIKAGGVMILLTSQDPQQLDDVYGQWQERKSENNYFIRYFHEELKKDMLVINQQHVEDLPKVPELAFSTAPEFSQHMTLQQLNVFQDMNRWLISKIPVFILTADRGRGKSTLLGMFSQQHKATGNIVVTAASKAQVKILFKQLDIEKNIQFIAPDDIIRRNEHIDCLIIDEAAMLPNSMLHQCLVLADKTLIATTTGGYEGTGQGFLIKFMQGFNSAQLMHRQLKGAIRWGQQDEMERWVNRVLMLKSVEQDLQLELNNLTVQQLSKKQLFESHDTLKAIYALLVSAHYRTRPSDLRQLMEDENQQLLVARSGNHIVGVLLLNREGGFDVDLSHDVYMGKRRPQGHLFAQMMTAQAGIKQFACLKGVRVQRLAVHENFRLKGIARLLIESAELLVSELKLDYLSTSFAFDSAVSPFWKKMGFSLVHISAGKGKSTGRQTVALIKSNDVKVNEIIISLQQKINNYLPVWLLSYCQSMIWTDVYALLDQLDLKVQFSVLDEDEIVSFSEGYRGFDLTQSVLQKLLISQLTHSQLSTPLIQLLIEKILLNISWENLSGQGQAHIGKNQHLKLIRQCILQLNEQRT